MKIIKIYSGFLFKDIYFKYDEEKNKELKIGDLIIFNSGMNDYRGKVKNIFKYLENSDVKNKLSKSSEFNFLRKCNEEDIKEISLSKDKEKEFLNFFSENYQQFNLSLEPNTCELSFDDKLLLFSYTSEERIDFRELVRFLAGKFRRRIQLKHLGIRDKASFFGGYGVCGRELCCSKFLKNIPLVPIYSPKVQDLLYKDMDNLLGVCGKLKCCLNYEVQQYQDIKKNMPNIGTSILMDGKKGIIIGVDIFAQKIKLKFPESVNIFELSELKEFIEKKEFKKPGIKNFKKPEIGKKFEKKPFKKFEKNNKTDLKKNNHHINSKEKSTNNFPKKTKLNPENNSGK